MWRARGKELLRGLRSVKRLVTDQGEITRRDKKRRALPAPEPVPALEDGAGDPEEPDEAPAVPREETAAPAPDPRPLPPIPESPFEDEELERVRAHQEEMASAPPEQRRARALDDVPDSIKRRLQELPEGAPEQKRLRPALLYALVAVTETKELQNERLSKYEISLLRSLTGLDITAARLHRAPRKRLQRPVRAG